MQKRLHRLKTWLEEKIDNNGITDTEDIEPPLQKI